MATYEFLQQALYRLLNDASANTYSDALVYDGMLAAHRAIMPWVPKPNISTLTSGSDGILLALPSDCYQIMALKRIATGEILRRAVMSPGTTRSSNTTTAVDWLEYPYGYISLSIQVEEGETFQLYYLAHWNVPENESDTDFVIEVPRHAHQGLLYYAGSHCLVPSAINSASIRQFNLRLDSGTPEDNPLKVEANYLLERFIHEMKMQPAFTKVGA